MDLKPFHIHLIRPTRYADDGYPLQWWRSLIPSNSLACVSGLVRDALARGVLQGQARPTVFDVDEINARVDPAAILARAKRAGANLLICLVGVQTNQFPRALDLARVLRAGGAPVCIGGFHVSGCLAMLDALPPELAEAQALGISFFAGEAEEARIDAVLEDGFAGALKPVYNHLKQTPSLGGAPIPFVGDTVVQRNLNRYSSFDLGRGCPFECSFCTIINVQGRRSRFRTADDLEAIVRENARIGVNRFFLTDDNFARNKNWRDLLERLVHLRRRHKLRVKLAVQVDALAHHLPGFIDLCVAAGVNQIFIGLETINAAALKIAKKKQNKVAGYREMLLAWKQHSVVVTTGYIIGFPDETKETILADIETLKRDLPIDNIYLNFLTPLPGCEDHKKMLAAGVWMDPDLNKYDLTHAVTHHPRMSEAEWNEAYLAAHASFYSWDHMETVLRRAVALRSKAKLTTVNRLLAYRESIRLEGVQKLEGGLWRVRRRLQRRPGMPIEPALLFYPRVLARNLAVAAGLIATLVRLRFRLARIERDPARLAYTDDAIRPIEPASASARVHAAAGALVAAE